MRYRVVTGIGLWVALSAAVFASDPISDVDPKLLDAELADVAFVDADTGWAVGDRGAIWHTGNGGQAWNLQASPAN